MASVYIVFERTSIVIRAQCLFVVENRFEDSESFIHGFYALDRPYFLNSNLFEASHYL